MRLIAGRRLLMKTPLLEQELFDAKQYAFDEINDLPEISHKNVVLAEAMIANDSDYILSGNIKAGPIGKYKGSTAYWMTMLRDALSHGSRELKSVIKEAVLAVDRDNSTHISSDSVGPEVLADRIYSKRHSLIKILKDRKKGFKFIQYLSQKTSEGALVKDGKTYFPRENYSFATKFCHYACLFFFDNDSEREFRDNYSIYDNVVANALPDYLKEYEIKKANGKNYSKTDFIRADSYELFSSLIDQLRDNKVSRNGFDHLLWYYHKAR